MLSFMDADEKTATVNTYKKLFEQAGEEGEQELMEALGSPVRLVLKLEKSYRSGKLNEVLEETASQYGTEVAVEEVGKAPNSNPAVLFYASDDSENPSEAEEMPAADLNEAVVFEAEESPVTEAEDEPFSEAGDVLLTVEEEDYRSDVLSEGELFWEEVEEAEAAPASEDTPVERRKGQKKAATPKASPVAAVLFTPFLIILAAAVLSVTFILAMVPGSLGTLFSVVGGYFAKYAFSSMSYMPDVLMVMGVGVVFFGLALGLVGMVIRLLVGGVKLDFDWLSSIYGRLLGKEKVQDE